MSKADPAAVFAALGDPTRLQLVQRLSDGADRSIQELSSGSTISRQATTKHLKVLQQARLVRSTRYGREVRFRLEQQALSQAEAFLAKVGSQWADALQRLAGYVEDDA